MKHIAFCCDDNYAKYLCVTIESILAAADDPASIKIWVFGDNISKDSQHQVAGLVARHGALCEICACDSSIIPATAPTHGHISTAAYIRIMLPDLLPDSVKRVLYLDCDLICIGNIEQLLEFDLEGRSLGAIGNPGFDRHAKLGLREEWNYLNSGVLLFDLDRWRKRALVEEAVRVMEEMHDKLLFHDQDTLNITLRGDWLLLPPRFNCQTSFLSGARSPGYSKEQWSEALENPLIIHYSSALKPWAFEGWHPWRWRYFQSMDSTSLAGFRPKPTGILSLIRYFRWRWRLGPFDSSLPEKKG